MHLPSASHSRRTHILQDFDEDDELKRMTIDFLNEIIVAPNLLQAEQKVANQLLTLLSEKRDRKEEQPFEWNILRSPPRVSTLTARPLPKM